MSGEKLADLNTTLTGVENELMRRALDRRDATIDDALDIINTAAENGDIELSDCGDCDDDDPESGGAAQGEPEEDPSGEGDDDE